MSHRILIALSVVALVLAACGGGATGTPTAGEATDFATACDRANNGKRIAVDGYLLFPDSFTGTDSIVLRLFEADDFAGTPIGVQTNIGSEANQVEMVSDQYSDEDLKVHTADGQVATLGTKVRVSGKVYFPSVGQDFTCGLENPLVEMAL